MAEGWIKIHRKTLKNPRSSDPGWLALWIRLICMATHESMDVIFNGERMALNPGQLITGRKILAKVSGLSESRVQRLLKLLESEQQIEQRTTPNQRLITIKNWDKYQVTEQRNEQRLNNERTTTEQRLNTNKNDKNDKNEIINIEIGKHFNQEVNNKHEIIKTVCSGYSVELDFYPMACDFLLLYQDKDIESATHECCGWLAKQKISTLHFPNLQKKLANYQIIMPKKTIIDPYSEPLEELDIPKNIFIS